MARSMMLVGVLLGVFALAACGKAPTNADAADEAASNIKTIAYTNSPVEEGAFEPFQVVLDLDTLKYTVPARDGYGTFRFDGTNVCFFASYSDKERCIDFLFPHEEWAIGQTWTMKSYDGKPIITTVDDIS